MHFPRTLLDDLCFVRQTIDDAGHLGLNNESASKAREILLRWIDELESEVAGQTLARLRNPVTTQVRVLVNTPFAR